jgi:hypothetical protein
MHSAKGRKAVLGSKIPERGNGRINLPVCTRSRYQGMIRLFWRPVMLTRRIVQRVRQRHEILVLDVCQWIPIRAGHVAQLDLVFHCFAP